MKNFTELMSGSLVQRARESNRLLKQISHCMPPELAERISFVRRDGDTLRICVSSAAMAAKLRFLGTTLCDTINATSHNGDSVHQYNRLQRISVHVVPATTQKDLKRQISHDREAPSPQAVERIRQVAKALDNDQQGDELANALVRLAGKLEKSRSEH